MFVFFARMGRRLTLMTLIFHLICVNPSLSAFYAKRKNADRITYGKKGDKQIEIVDFTLSLYD